MRDNEIISTVGEQKSGLIREYLGYLKEKKSRSSLTLDSYASDLSQFTVFLSESGGVRFSDTDACILSADPQIACRFFDFLKNQYTPSTLIRKITAIRGFYRYLAAQHKLQANPFSNISMQPIQSASPDYLEEQHLQQLFDVISGSGWLAARDRAIAAMLYCTGMRVSELLHLTTEDIDLDTAVLQIRTADRAARPCTLPAWALHTVERYIERRQTNAPKNPVQEDVLFVNCDGGPLTARSIRRKLADYSRRANLPFEATPAVLRHSYAMHMLRNGADTKAVRRQLGHLSASSMRPYLNCLSAGQTQAVPVPETLEIVAP